MSRTLRARQRARNYRRWRDAHFWSPGPYSHLDRLREAAFGGDVCRVFTVLIEGATT